MDECKFVVHDDEARILDKEFDNFEDAYDYAQDGLVTFIYRVCGDEEEEIVWSWDDTHDRDEAIKRVNGNFETPVEEQVEIEIKADEPEELADLADCVFGGECKFFDTEFEKPVDEVKVEFDPAKFQEYEDEWDDCDVETPENPFTFDFSIKDEKKPEDRPEEDEDSEDEEDEKKDESLEESVKVQNYSVNVKLADFKKNANLDYIKNNISKENFDLLTSILNSASDSAIVNVVVNADVDSELDTERQLPSAWIEHADLVSATLIDDKETELPAELGEIFLDAANINAFDVLNDKMAEDDFDDMTDEEFVEAFGKAKFGNKDLEEEVKPEEQDLNLDNIPLEVPVEMDIEVEEEVGGDPIADGRTGGDDIRYSDARTIYGKIESYDYEPDFDQVIECLKKMLNKDTLTQADIGAVKEDDYLKFAAEYFEDEAVKEVEKKVNQGDTDNLGVKWEDGEYY